MPSSVAVIGAGIAGSAAARALTEAGHTVRVFDKGRAPGGRTSTRWYDDQRQFDHGCATFTARSPEFVQAVQKWVQQGVAAPALGTAPGTMVFTGTPRMGSIAAHLVRGLSVRCGVGPGGGEVWRISRDGARWRLYDKLGAAFEPVFDGVVVATPAPQAAQLLAFMPALAERLRKVAMAPTWTLMAEFAGGDASGAEPGGQRPAGTPGEGVPSSVLSQVLVDSEKRPGPARAAFVAHATEAWTREHLEMEPEQVEPLLLAALRQAVPGVGGEPVFIKAHRWRYARVTEADPRPFALEPERRIGACGDGFTADAPDLEVRFGTVEAAYLSGVALARELAARLAESTG